MTKTEPTAEQLRSWAKDGARLEAIRIVTEFPDVLADLNALANGNGTTPARRGRPPGHTVSAAARRRLSAAMKRRWKKIRAESK